jgi:glycolate oxidase
MQTLREELYSIVGEDRVTDNLLERILYSHDLAPIPPEVLTLFKTLPDAVVRPTNAKEIAELIKYARKKKIPVIPRGAASWAYGGATPVKGGIVLDLTGMNKIIEIDKQEMTVTVETGINWKKLLEELEKKNLFFPVYPTSAPSATVGGWICTGGLGIGSLKYGQLKENVVEIEVVTPTGEIVQVPNKPNYKLDWFFGSEGTLGIITKATLRIHPEPEVFSPHAICFNDTEQMCNAVSKILKDSTEIYFIKFTDEGYLDIRRSLGLFAPKAAACALFVFEGSKKTVRKDLEKFHSIIKKMDCSELDAEKSHEEWDERFHPMRIKRAGPTLLAGDVLVPVSKLYEFFERLWKLKEKFNLKMGIEGTVVSRDSTVVMPMFLSDERKRWKYLTAMPAIKEITDLALKIGGKPYGGFGIWNSFYLDKVYSNLEIRKMKERKKKLDPDNIMNPGKLYRVQTKFRVPLTAKTYNFFMFLLKILRRFD